jgi:hypothetical protein
MTQADTKELTPTGATGLRFTVASRPQRRFSNTQTVSNFTAAGSFSPIPLPATGFVRKVQLFFNFTATFASAGVIVAGDGPFNLVAGITLTDATGMPVFQPVTGYNMYIINKYIGSGVTKTNIPRPYHSPQMGPEYAFASTATTGTATFRLDIDLEQDYNSGYGCIPNLDANASLQLKIDYAIYTVAFSGTTPSAATASVRVSQWYWAPVGATVGAVPVQTTTPGFGDYVETRYETQTATASAENTFTLNNKGGLIKAIAAVSRAAGVRTAITAATNIGLILDNNPIDEGIPLEEHYAMLRQAYGYIGTDLTTSYAPLAAGTLPGLDRGVVVWPEHVLSGGRDSWLTTRIGSLLQVKVTPGASATQMEFITQLAQVKNPAAFYSPMSLD